MVGDPQRTSSKPTTAGTFHPGAICPPRRSVKVYERIFGSLLPPLHVLRLPSLFGSEAHFNVQVLFVHSVHTHVCQKELLQYSITALTAREHHRQKKNRLKKCRSVCFLCSLTENLKIRGWGIFRGIYSRWLFRTLLTRPPVHCETIAPPSGQMWTQTNTSGL